MREMRITAVLDRVHYTRKFLRARRMREGGQSHLDLNSIGKCPPVSHRAGAEMTEREVGFRPEPASAVRPGARLEAR